MVFFSLPKTLCLPVTKKKITITFFLVYRKKTEGQYSTLLILQQALTVYHSSAGAISSQESDNGN